MRRVIEMFPGLDVIACHFGGYRLLDEAEENIIGLPVYVDTAWPPSLGDIDAERLRAIIERHGPERVLFGSDWPMASPADELGAVRALGLGPEQTAGVLGDNMKRLLERYEKDR
jgi:predicted TIM-barrel fold metal-dependent hydrolase